MLSELWKQYTLTFVLNNGSYQWSYIPFQLCSIPMYLCLILGMSGKLNFTRHGNIRIRKFRRAGITFLADYTLMSGIVTFLDTSGLHYGYAPLTIHSYLWHIIIAGIGVYSGLKLISECKTKFFCNRPEHPDGRRMPLQNVNSYSDRRLKSCSSCRQDLQKKQQDRFEQRVAISDFLPASCIYLICCGIAELINLSFDRYGIVNMFYINPHYYVNQIVFNDLAHTIPNNIVIVLYKCCTMLAAFIVHMIWMSIYKNEAAWHRVII